MKKTLHVFAVFVWLLLVAPLTTPQAEAAFSDVPANSPYASDIQYLEDRDIVQGETFLPDESMTRADFAQWAIKNAGFHGKDYRPKSRWLFYDVRKNNEARPYVLILADLGILEDEHGKTSRFFNPQKPITRAEALRWLFTIHGIPVPKIFDEATYGGEDVPVRSELAPLIDKAIRLGILTPGKVHPRAHLKRREAARYLKLVSSTTPTLTITVLPTAESDILRNQKYDVLATSWNKILETYLRRSSVDKDALIYGAIEGMVKELKDKYSEFERPGENTILEVLSGEVEGIGAVIQKKDDVFVVVSPISGSPAEKAGLQAHDIIIEADGKPLKGLTLSEVVGLIKGPHGTQVHLKIKREGKLLEFTITRDIVKIASATAERKDDIAIVTLRDFGSNTVDEFRPIVEDLVKNPPKGIVLDMRNNPGGYLDKAVDMAGFFIESGKKVSVVRYPHHEETYSSAGNAELGKIPLIILMNAGSASAAEILAGALQDYGMGKVIGEKSYGKGTVQEVNFFSDGSMLKLTVAEWLTPKGRTIQPKGIKPDIKVKMTAEDRKNNRDPQMDRALEELRK